MNTLPSSAPRVRPSAWWFLLIPLLLVAGVGFGVQRGIDEARAIADSFERLGSDGVGTIELEAGDEATVWAIWEDGRASSSLARPSVDVTVTTADDEPVPFARRTGAETTFSFGSLAGIDLGTFTAPAAGTYEVKVAAAGQSTGLDGPPPEAAVGRIDLSNVVGGVFAPIIWGGAAALVTLILLIVLRSRSKRRIRASAAPQPALGIPGERPPATPTATSDQPDPNGPISFS